LADRRADAFFLPWPSYNPFALLVGLAASDGSSLAVFARAR
jgi:hypothetical protein